MTEFAADTYQNEFLARDATQVDALVTVTASGADDVVAGPVAAEIVIVDVSGSMKFPRTKIKSAITATCAAIDCIRDGVQFAVIAGSDDARHVYPGDATLVTASATTRTQAKDSGAQAQGRRWHGDRTLADRRELAAGRRAPGICHAILLTDGENQNETAEELEAALEPCEGRFQCDCRGVGADWEVAELRTVASKLLGTVEAIREPEDLAADFAATMERAMGRRTSNVSLRVWTPVGARVTLMQQVFPTIEDLTDRRAAVGELEGDYPTGAWGDETRALPRVHRGPRTRRRRRDARRAGEAPRRRRRGLGGEGPRDLDRRRRQVDPDQPGARALHGPGGVVARDRRSVRRAPCRRRGHRDREVRERGADRERARRHSQAPARWRPWSRSSKPRPVRCARRSTSTSSTASPSKRARSRPTASVEGAMSTICPRGHPSQTTDYCDQCGAPMDAAPAEDEEVVESRSRCRRPPSCARHRLRRRNGVRGARRHGSPATATARIAATTSRTGAERRVVARGRRRRPRTLRPARAGRHRVPRARADANGFARRRHRDRGSPSPARGIQPDIDLSGPPEDPGVSREHLRLERTSDGGFSVVDCGSANGTTLNDDHTPIPPGTPVPLSAGDRIHLGAWTTITVHAADPPASA